MRGSHYAALVTAALLGADGASAGTNTWTFSSGLGAACSPKSSWGEIVTCVPSASNTANPLGAPHNVTGSNTSDSTSPFGWSLTLSNAFGGGLDSNWIFTDSCGSMMPARSWNATFGGCAEICTAPDTLNTATGLCEAPPDCSTYSGREVDRFFDAAEPLGAICATPPAVEDMDCEALVAEPVGVSPCVDGRCFARLRFTGNQCGAEPDATAESLVDEAGHTNCVAGGGLTFCAAQSSQNCGTVNGQAVCLQAVPPGRCTFLGNGGMVCASDASAPPAPTESDGMTPATADGDFSAQSELVPEPRDFNYFSPGTVAGSGTPVSGSSGADEPDGEEEDDCEGCAFSAPSIGEADSFAAVTGAMFDALASSPWGSAIAAPVDFESAPEGACPEESFDMFGETYTIDLACDLWPGVAPILTACFLLVYVVIGVRIVASA